MEISPQLVESSSPLTWVLNHQLKNENGQLLEFHNHRFLIEPYMDWDPYIVVKKASQIGWSTLAILRAIHLAAKRGANVVYTLPTRQLGEEFLTPKFDPIVENNPEIARLLTGTKNISLKKIGTRWLYFRGSFKETEAVSISVHAHIADEYDRSDQKVLGTYETRLDAAPADFRWQWVFSNPSVPGFGVDKFWNISTQLHWLVTCPKGHAEPLEWPKSIDIESARYICQNCGATLSDEARRMGQWVAKYPGRKWKGYWVSQMMVPTKPASEIIGKSTSQTPEVFHNFTLGTPFINSDTRISPEDIIDACYPNDHVRTRVSAMGVDVGLTKHFTVGNEHGVYRIGTTPDWDEIERVMLTENVSCCVIDAAPDITVPRQLASKYPGRVYLARYVGEQHELKSVFYDDVKIGLVKIDRTRAIDQVVADIRNQAMVFNLDPNSKEIQELITHATNIYRITVETKLGPQSRWEHAEGSPEHFVHSLVYLSTALSRLQGALGVVTRPKPPSKETNPRVDPITRTIPGLDIHKIARQSGKRRILR